MIWLVKIICGKYRNLKTQKYHIFWKKTLGISVACIKCGNEYKKYFKKKNQLKFLKNLGLITNIEEYQKYVIIIKKT